MALKFTTPFAVKRGFMLNPNNWRAFMDLCIGKESSELTAKYDKIAPRLFGPYHRRFMGDLRLGVEEPGWSFQDQITVLICEAEANRLQELLYHLFGDDFSLDVPPIPGIEGKKLAPESVHSLLRAAEFAFSWSGFNFSGGIIEGLPIYKFPWVNLRTTAEHFIVKQLKGDDCNIVPLYLWEIFTLHHNDAAKSLLLSSMK